MNWSRDYTNMGQVCPEKALLRALTDSTEKSDFDLYYEYLKKFKLSHSHVNLRGNETRPNRAEKWPEPNCLICPNQIVLLHFWICQIGL